jgi:hypothetical protein
MSWCVACARPESMHCHPEPFGKLKINSAKDLEILRRYTPHNDTQDVGFRMNTS